MLHLGTSDLTDPDGECSICANRMHVKCVVGHNHVLMKSVENGVVVTNLDDGDMSVLDITRRGSEYCALMDTIYALRDSRVNDLYSLTIVINNIHKESLLDEIRKKRGNPSTLLPFSKLWANEIRETNKTINMLNYEIQSIFIAHSEGFTGVTSAIIESLGFDVWRLRVEYKEKIISIKRIIDGMATIHLLGLEYVTTF